MILFVVPFEVCARSTLNFTAWWRLPEVLISFARSWKMELASHVQFCSLCVKKICLLIHTGLSHPDSFTDGGGGDRPTHLA